MNISKCREYKQSDVVNISKCREYKQSDVVNISRCREYKQSDVVNISRCREYKQSDVLNISTYLCVSGNGRILLLCSRQSWETGAFCGCSSWSPGSCPRSRDACSARCLCLWKLLILKNDSMYSITPRTHHSSLRFWWDFSLTFFAKLMKLI